LRVSLLAVESGQGEEYLGSRIVLKQFVEKM
jgi:hypothetical protein